MSLTLPVGDQQEGQASGSWAAVAVVAAIPRLVWVFVASREPVGLFDPAIYLGAANSIAAGRGYRSLTGTLTSYYPPGYPFFLGVIRWVTDLVGLTSHFFLIVGLVQTALGVLTCLGVMFIASRIAGPFCGLAAGLIMALWPNLVMHSSLLLSETLFMAVLIGSLVLLIIAIDRWPESSARPADGSNGTRIFRIHILVLGAAGIMCGLAVLTRPQSGFLVVPAVAFAGLLSGAGPKRSATAASILAAGILLMVLPWGIRNQARLGSFVPVSTNTGDNLCIGFNPDANGGFAMPPACQTDTSYTDGPRAEVSRDGKLRRGALSWARSNVARLPGLSLSKLRITFGSDADAIRASESFGEDPFLGERPRAVLRFVSNAYYYVALLLALAGVLLLFGCLRRSRLARSRKGGEEPPGASGSGKIFDPAVLIGWAILLIAAFSVLVPVLSFGDPRFKVPFEPMLAILAAVTLTQIRHHFLRPGN